MSVVKYLHENRNEGCTHYAMDYANGDLSIIKFLDENRSEGCTVDAMNWSSKYGHLQIVEFLETIKFKKLEYI